MKFDEIFNSTKYAFENNEVYELLNGQKGYAYQSPMTPASIPTDDSYIYQEGIYPYYESLTTESKAGAISTLNEAYIQMIKSDDALVVWWALSSLFGQKLNEFKYKKSPFFIADNLLNQIAPYLIRHKESLIHSQAYGGCAYTSGLWDDVLRYDRLLFKYCNYKLFG